MRGWVVWFALAAACGGERAPATPPEREDPAAQARAAPLPVAQDAIDPGILEQIEHAPEAALARLDAAPPSEPSPSARIVHELARWSLRERPPAFAVHLREAGVDPADPAVAAALQRVVSAAIDARTAGVALTAYAGWLDGVPQAAAFDPAARALALRLHELLLEIDAGDLADRVALRTLSRDPEHAQLAREHIATLLSDEQIEFLREQAVRTPAPSWVVQLARELDQTANRGDLENPAAREQIAQAMSELGDIPVEEARRRLLASLRIFDEP